MSIESEIIPLAITSHGFVYSCYLCGRTFEVAHALKTVDGMGTPCCQTCAREAQP